MNFDSRTSDPLVAKAAALLARRDAGWSAEEAAEFALWRAASPAHDAAMRKVESSQQLLQRLPDSPTAAALQQEIEALYARRRVVRFPQWARWAGLVAAAACLTLVVWLGRTPHRNAAVNFAANAQPRMVDLNDGSTLQMSAGSEVEVALDAAQRHIALRHGAVHFSVAKDAARPFIVDAGSVSVRAVGTAFVVNRAADEIRVNVTEGKVQVTRVDSATPAAPPLFLVAGEGAAFGGGRDHKVIATEAPGVRGPASVGSWHAPRLEFSNTPLADVLVRFNQYSRVQLELGDAELATRPVGGTFDADQAEVFVNLLVAAGDVQVQRVSETHLILRKAR